MPLSVGDKLGPYEITGLLGTGGMGEVYSARDSRLHREVAVKVSAEKFNDRFEREARAVAALNHHNVCILHDVGPNYLVMELVDGETLADRIRQGPIPFNDALAIAKQIADALEAAHEKGITHRDLKPANVKIRPDGMVKVLDFGLAKMPESTGSSVSNSDDSPTMTMEAATKVGVILGTAGYMSPEQARGKKVDRRADIWAFGVVLHEMLTGRRLFQGESLTDTLAAVVKDEPDLGNAPPQVLRLLRKCLEKDPKKRLRDIGDAWELLEAAPATTAVQAAAQTQSKLPWILAVAGLALAGVFVFLWLRREPPPPAQLVRFDLMPPAATTFAGSPPAISPDGRKIAFVATDPKAGSMIYIRSLEAFDSQLVTGTDGALYAFWSPDGRSLGFTTRAGLKRIDISGGSVRILASGIVGAQNGTWNQKGDILFFPQTSTGAIHKDSGGTTSEVTKLDTQAGERSHRFPQFLPDGKRFLFFAYMKDNTTNGRVNLGELGSLEHKTVLEGGSAAIFARTPDGDGYLIFAKGNTLMGQRFDESAGKVLGEAVTIADNVGGSGNLGMMPNVAASATGLLVYSSASGSAGSARFTWFDRNGKKLSDLPPEVSGSQPTISPDEKLLAAVRDDPVRRSPDIWITDLVRGVPSRLTFGPLDVQNPVWSSDSKQVAFHTHGAKGQGEIHRKDATGAGTENTVAESLAGVLDWSPDGRYLLIAADGSLLLQPTAGGPTVEVMKGTGMFANNTGQARFSRDGKYIAYASSESGQFEIYVTPVPPAKGKWQVSSKGGYQPSWRRDNKEIYYIAPDQNLMAVDVKSGEAFQPGTPQALFRTSSAYTLVTRNTYDVSGDGQKFLFPTPSAEERVTPLTVVMNWWAGIKK